MGSTIPSPGPFASLIGPRRIALCALVPLLIPYAMATDETAQALAARSAIVLTGTVLKVHASEEPSVAPSARTVVIHIEHMQNGTEIAGDQSGRTATAILTQADKLKTGQVATFFGNPKVVGASLTIADEGEILVNGAPNAAALAEASVQSSNDQNLKDRLADASSIFRGHVESVGPLAAAAGAPAAKPQGGEHGDPDYQIASVRVTSAIRGATPGQVVSVVFPASRDIKWFNVPKLKVGQDALIIGHKPTADTTPVLQASPAAEFVERQNATVLTQPGDVLPVADENRIRSVL